MAQADLGMPPPPQSKTWSTVDVVLMVVASFVVLVAGLFAIRALKLDLLGLSLAASILEALALVGSVYILGIRRKGLDWQAVGLRRPERKWTLVAIGAGVVCIWLTGAIALLVQMLLHLPNQNPQLQFLAPSGFTWVAAVGMFLLAGIVVPLAEEVFFRGVLYTWLRQRWGVLVGVIASALIFGAVHGDTAIAAGVAAMGIIQAVIYERSRSLWTTFLVHAINNAFKVVLLYALLAMGVNLLGK